MLEKRLKDSEFVLLFDESLNKELQKKQLDMFVRLWDHDRVSSRYLISDFLGHGFATDLVDSFESKVEQNVGLSRLVQLSMDRPNVNWAAFEKLNQKICADTGRKLLNVGSCGLHTVHNAFSTAVGVTGWSVSDSLYAMHWLFKDTPARREDYENVTKQALYPLKYCAHHWVENTRVCERALHILPHLIQYVDSVSKKVVKDPGTKSFQSVKHFCSDKLAKSKLGFIISIAKPIENFLTNFQSDKPMLPFIATQLEMLLRDVMKRFIKTEVIASATTTQKLISIDVNDEKNHKHIHRVDVGCVATEELKVVEKNKSVSERQIFDFKASCKTFLLTLTGKLMAKSPLHKSIVRNLTCLNPVEICTHNQKCIDKFKAVVSVLISEKYIHVLDGDEVQRQFEYFVEEYKHSVNFTSFSKEKDRLDQLYFSSMANDKKYGKLWPVISKLLLLSHGQATVERGFSTNKEVLEQNFPERNLMAKRVIKDFIKHVGGIQNIEVTKELLQSAQSARQMYFSYLEESKKC